MVNQFMYVGRLTDNVEIKEENGKKYANITLESQREYKNEEGIYETDIFTIELKNELALRASEYCEKGDIIGIRGKMETRNNNIYLVAEKMTFLASRK